MAPKYAGAPHLFVEDCYRVAGEYGVEPAGLLKHMSFAVVTLARIHVNKRDQLYGIIRCLCDAGYTPPS